MTFLIALLAVSCIAFVTGIIYLVTGLGKWFYHDLLLWHKPSDFEGFDGCSCTSRCKYCGKEIMQDSQGGWFEV